MQRLANPRAQARDSSKTFYFGTQIVLGYPVEPLLPQVNTGGAAIEHTTKAEHGYYIADIERFWLWVDHTLFLNELGITGNAFSAPGFFRRTFPGDLEEIPFCPASQR